MACDKNNDRTVSAGRDIISGDRVSRDEAGGNITNSVSDSSTHITGSNAPIFTARGDVSVSNSQKTGMPAWLVMIIIISLLITAGFGAEFMGVINLFR